MRTLDEPESPDVSPDGKQGGVCGAAGRHGRHLHDRPRLRARSPTSPRTRSPTPGRRGRPTGGSSSTWRAISGNEKLFRLDVDTGRKTQLTFGTHDDAAAQFLDADTLVFPSTATNPSQPVDPEVARNGNIYNIWTLSLKNRRAAPVHRHDRRQHVRCGHAPRIAGSADGLHRLLQGQLRAARAREARPDHHRGLVGLRRARRHHRLPGAAGPHADGRQDQAQGQVREDVRGRAAAGERRRDERRRPVRRHGGDVQRRAGRPAVQHVRRVGLAVPDVFVVVPEPRAPLQLRAPGLLADAVLLRAAGGRVLRPVLLGHHRPRFRSGHAHDARRHGVRHLAVQPLPARGSVRRDDAVQRELQRPRPRRRVRIASRRRSSARRSSATAPSYRSGITYVQETTVFREFGPLSGNTVRVSVRDARRRSATRCRARRSMPTHGTTSASAGRACWRCAPRSSGAGARRRTSCISAATPRCAATSYLSFLGSESAFFNAELRFPLIHAMLTPLGVMGGIRGVFFANMGGGQLRGSAVPVVDQQDRDLHADHRLPADQPRSRRNRSTACRGPSTVCGSWTPAPPTASASKPSRWASPSTSTGRGRRSSTRIGKT